MRVDYLIIHCDTGDLDRSVNIGVNMIEPKSLDKLFGGRHFDREITILAQGNSL